MKKAILINRSAAEESVRALTSLIIMLLLLSVSGNSITAAVLTQVKDQKEDSRMILLEKLEKGLEITSEEIRAGLNPSYGKDGFNEGFELPEIPDFPEFPGHPEICINPPQIYISNDFEIDEQTLRELKESISKSLGEMKKEIESVIHSDEMQNFQREMKEWGEEIRREVEKAVREIKTEKETTLKIEGVRS